jgi:hypothetical protein
VGVDGWNPLGDQVIAMTGLVEATSYESGGGPAFDDHDWDLIIRPQVSDRHLLAAPGKQPQDMNTAGHMDCEVCPIDEVNQDATQQGFVSGLVGKNVTINGYWVEDLSHGGKTELHPMTSLFVYEPLPGGGSGRLETFLFVDKRVPGESSVPLTIPPVPHAGACAGGGVMLELSIPYGSIGDCFPTFSSAGQPGINIDCTIETMEVVGSPASGELSLGLTALEPIGHEEQQWNFSFTFSAGVNAPSVAPGPDASAPSPCHGFFHHVVILAVDTTRSFVPYNDETGNRPGDHPPTAGSRQTGWFSCARCNGLWFGPSGPAGVCPAGGAHTAVTGGRQLSLVNNISLSPGQHGWRWCRACHGLWFSGGSSQGTCPGNPTFAQRSTDPVVTVPTAVGTRPIESRAMPDHEGTPVSGSPIPRPLGSHVAEGSGDYSLIHGVVGAPGDSSWRWCKKCQGLWTQDGAVTGGICPAGDQHVSTGSGDYQLIFVNMPAPALPTT